MHASSSLRSKFNLACVVSSVIVYTKMIDLLAISVDYQHTNCLKHNAISLSKIHKQDSYTRDYLCNTLVITCVPGFALNLGDK